MMRTEGALRKKLSVHLERGFLATSQRHSRIMGTSLCYSVPEKSATF